MATTMNEHKMMMRHPILNLNLKSNFQSNAEPTTPRHQLGRPKTREAQVLHSSGHKRENPQRVEGSRTVTLGIYMRHTNQTQLGRGLGSIVKTLRRIGEFTMLEHAAMTSSLVTLSPVVSLSLHESTALPNAQNSWHPHRSPTRSPQRNHRRCLLRNDSG